MKDTTAVGENVESWQLTFANCSHVKYEFTNTKTLVKKLARIETGSICRQQIANMFANCLSCEGRLRAKLSERKADDKLNQGERLKTRELRLTTGRFFSFSNSHKTVLRDCLRDTFRLIKSSQKQLFLGLE